jgi:hypothetical protein
MMSLWDVMSLWEVMWTPMSMSMWDHPAVQ